MIKIPKQSDSIHSLKEREAKARKVLKESGYTQKEIEKIINKAFYVEEKHDRTNTRA
jgi:hypothetical protein